MAALASTLTEALPTKDRVREVKERLEKAGVKYVLSCWIDLFGLPKTKPVPMSDFEALCAGKGPQFAVHSISFVPELTPADSDQIPIPDLDAVYICPWDKSCAWIFADLWWENKPYNVCPRQALKRAIEDAKTAGYVGYAGIEPEFMVMKWNEQGQPVKAFDNDPAPGQGLRPRRQAFGYDVEFSVDSMKFLKELIDILQELGWGVHDVVAEGAYSQFELDFHYTHLLEMADRLVFLRVLLKEVAKKHGFFVTFMPKPTTADWRSGAHINFSLQSTKAPGENLFQGEDGKWSELTNHALGGLMAHADALAAITCPTVNSYNGLVPRVGGFEGGTVTWAPTNITYGHNNRSAMFRLPQSRFCIENRAADMCMNVYLALAMTLTAAMEGISGKIDPGAPTNRDLYSMSEQEMLDAKIRRLPRNLFDATEKLRRDDLARRVLGPTMMKSYLAYKVDEWERYHQTVTDWEVREYLRLDEAPTRHIEREWPMPLECQLFDLGRVDLQSGGTLPGAVLAYQTYGQLNKAGDNAVLLPTFYTGTHYRNEGFFGAGRALDPVRHFIISVNMLGNGLSSSPSNTAAPFGGRDFPKITLHDNVRFQHLLLTERLKIQNLALVAGWSMAGCQAYEWAAQFPDRVRAILPFCASAKTSIHNIVFLEGVKAALQADETWNSGAYTSPPVKGLKAFGRVYAGWAYSQTFFRERLYQKLGFATHEELLVDWELDHLNWDANDLLAKLWSWQNADISANPLYSGDIAKALKAIAARAILMPCSDDLYFPPEDNAIEAQHMERAELRVFHSPWGHCAPSPGNEPAFARFLDEGIRDLLQR